MNLEKWEIIHIHNTYFFLRGNPMQEKTMELFFLYSFKNCIHLKNQLPLFYRCNWKEAPTPYISRIQPEGSSNSPILWLQLEGGYDPQCSPATTTCPCLVLPPWSRSRMMEPLSHYHCEIYHYKPIPINLNHASTCTSTCNQPVP